MKCLAQCLTYTKHCLHSNSHYWIYIVALKIKIRTHYWTYLVVQWLRIPLPMQRIQVRSLGWEDSICCRAIKSMRHNYWSLCIATRESAYAVTKTQHSQKNKLNKLCFSLLKKHNYCLQGIENNMKVITQPVTVDPRPEPISWLHPNPCSWFWTSI